MLKPKHLDKGIRNAIDLAPILLDEKETTVPELASIIYDLCETGIDSEESLEESIVPVTNSDLIAQVREVYRGDKIIQRVMAAKAAGQPRIP